MTGLQRLQSVSGCAPASPLYFNQAWAYNNLNKLTEIDTSAQSGGVPQGSTNPGTATYFFAKYAFSATGNNGQIQSMTDARTGNTVSYQYDLLKRVTSATATGGTAWGQTFGYDGFGNLTSKSVPAGSSEITLPGVNAQKNQLLGSTYDNNGNVLTLNNATLAYDVENRLTSYTASGGFVENYAYDEGNRRVEKWNNSGKGVSDNVYFYGPDGKLLSVLNVSITANSPWFALSTAVNRIYFGGMVLGSSSGYATADTNLMKDRLGSARPAYPYGTDISSGVAEGDDFATYWQDYHTGFEYAMNRYYSASYGRFLTVDPFGGSANLAIPGSLNRYVYGSGDPSNLNDPSGLDPDPNTPPFGCDLFGGCVPGYNCPIGDTNSGLGLPFSFIPGVNGEDFCSPIPSGAGGGATSSQWTLEVGYTPVINSHTVNGVFDHLFIELQNNTFGFTDFVSTTILDGGPAESCKIVVFGCGNVQAWRSFFGHYDEVFNPAASIFFQESISGVSAIGLIRDEGRLASALNSPRYAIAYNPITGPNSNSVAYTLLQDAGVSLSGYISQVLFGVWGLVDPFGVLQNFTGWHQYLNH